MKQALLVHGSKQTPVTVEEAADGGLIVHLHNRELFRLQPSAEVAYPDIAAVKNKKPVMSDLTGDPAHDWPLFVKLLRNHPDLLAGVAHWYKNKIGYSVPGIEAMARAEEDLEMLLPLLPNLITSEGQLKRGHRARIAETLGIKDAGNYTKRIDAVVGLISAGYEELLGNFEPKLGNFGPSLGNEAKSTRFQEPPKAVNQ